MCNTSTFLQTEQTQQNRVLDVNNIYILNYKNNVYLNLLLNLLRLSHVDVT